MDKDKTFSKIAPPSDEEASVRGRQYRKAGNRKLIRRQDEVELGFRMSGPW